MKSTLLVVALLAPALAHADDSSSTIALGLGLAASQSPYAGVGTQTSVLPLLTYESERFFVQGLTGGIHLLDQGDFGLSVFVAGRLDGIDADDFGRRELARNGIDRDLLEDRDHGVDAGLRTTWKGLYGALSAMAKADVSGASEGFELGVDYAYPLQAGGFTLTPGVGLNYLSDNLADYYYGTLDKEIARGVERYRPGAAVVPSIAVGVSRPFGDHWQLNAEARYKWLPNDITDSPLTEGDAGSFAVKLGVSWRF